MGYFVAVVDRETNRFEGFVNVRSTNRKTIQSRIHRFDAGLKKLGKPFQL